MLAYMHRPCRNARYVDRVMPYPFGGVRQHPQGDTVPLWWGTATSSACCRTLPKRYVVIRVFYVSLRTRPSRLIAAITWWTALSSFVQGSFSDTLVDTYGQPDLWPAVRPSGGPAGQRPAVRRTSGLSGPFRLDKRLPVLTVAKKRPLLSVIKADPMPWRRAFSEFFTKDQKKRPRDGQRSSMLSVSSGAPATHRKRDSLPGKPDATGRPHKAEESTT